MTKGGTKRAQKGIATALGKLPLFKGTYLYMQLLNVDVVDRYIEQLEHEVLREYIDTERTPFGSVTFLSALSQW